MSVSYLLKGCMDHDKLEEWCWMTTCFLWLNELQLYKAPKQSFEFTFSGLTCVLTYSCFQSSAFLERRWSVGLDWLKYRDKMRHKPDPASTQAKMTIWFSSSTISQNAVVGPWWCQNKYFSEILKTTLKVYRILPLKLYLSFVVIILLLCGSLQTENKDNEINLFPLSMTLAISSLR